MASFFIIDNDTAIASGAGSLTGPLQFRHHHPAATAINDAKHPEAAVAFSLERVEEMAPTPT